MDKECKICKQTKEISEFQFRKDSGKHRNECKLCSTIRLRKWKKENNYDRSQYIKHKDKKLAAIHSYRNNPKNKSKIRKCQNNWRKRKMQSDPEFKIKHNLRRRCQLALKGHFKHETTMKLVGCSEGELKKHLESLWLEDMSWENYGLHGWHIDHIKPLSSFDLTKKEEQIKAFHFSNLQPLWAKDNLSKGST